MNMDKNIQEIPIEDIIPNRFQPRLTFNEEGLNELSDSIKQHGIIQPLVVRKLGDKYEIIAGERRYKAATQAGLSKVPVIVSDIDDNKSAEVALVENIQRRNLTAIEEAKSYKNLLERGYLTQEQLAAKMGVSQSSIANKLRLLNLDEEVQDALLNEKISERHARALLSLDSKEEQKKWLKKILDERMTVRQLDMELKKLKEDPEDEGIPLVNINPDLDTILNTAEDINVVRSPHDVASMLQPQEKEVPSPEPIMEQKNTIDKVPNKFFNFLEDEQANMDIGSDEEIFNSFNPMEPPKEEVSKIEEEQQREISNLDNVEVLEDLEDGIENSVIPEILPQEKTEEPKIMMDPFASKPIEEPKEESIRSFENIFGNDKIKNTNDEPIPVPIQKEPLIDPMDSVAKLDPEYEEKQEELVGLDLKSAINTIRDTVENLNRKGFTIETEEADLENLYHITIKITKD